MTASGSTLARSGDGRRDNRNLNEVLAGPLQNFVKAHAGPYSLVPRATPRKIKAAPGDPLPKLTKTRPLAGCDWGHDRISGGGPLEALDARN
jgi:hypothetical protein